MMDIPDEEKPRVNAEIKKHLTTLHNLKSKILGGPTGIVIPPYRVSKVTMNDKWNLKASDAEEYVFCHNDLSQQNIILDQDTFKIKAIIDWEYAGFYPDMFEYPLWRNHHKDQGEDHLQVAHLVEFLDTSNSPKAADVDTRTNYYKVRRTTQWASRDMGAEPVCLHFSRRMECPS